MKRNGCAVQLFISLAYVIICLLTAFFLYRFCTLIIDPLIAGACEEPEVPLPVEGIPPLPRPTIAEYDMAQEQEDYENRLIEEALLARAHRIDDCMITFYCCEPYAHICGTGDGLTALGGPVLPYVSCAVPKEIPLGSTIMIDWGDGDLEYRRADDRGGGVNGSHIDLAVPTHEGALELGVKFATVYWVEEEFL